MDRSQTQASVEHLLTLPKASDRSSQRRQKYEQESSLAVAVDHLLQLPKPTDRSHQRRQKYEREGLHLGEFLPEQEPKGVRGQEAKVIPFNGEGAGFFNNVVLPKTNHKMAIRIVAPNVSDDEYDDDDDDDEIDDNDEVVHQPPKSDLGHRLSDNRQLPSAQSRSGILRPSTRLPTPQQAQPRRVVTPPSNNVSFKMATAAAPAPVPIPGNSSPSDESTNSDVNIEHMLQDLIPSFSTEPSSETPRHIANHSSMSLSSQQSPIPSLQYAPQHHVTSSRGQAMSPSAVENMLTTVASTSPSESLGSYHFFPTLPPNQHQQQQPHDLQQRLQQQQRVAQPSLATMYATPKSQIGTTLSSSDNILSINTEQVEELNAKAIKHVHNGDYDLALTAFTRVLQLYQSLYGDLHPLVASTYHNLGMVHSKRATFMLDNTLHQGHVRAQSLQCFQAAARTARDSPLLGPNHPNVAVSLVRIGFLLLQSRQYQHAITTFQEALRIRLQAYGPRHGLVANLYNNLGVCYMHTGDYARGRQFLDMALELQEEQIERLKLLQDQKLTEDQERENMFITARLELADTLCNIGGLCLEWIRKQGPDARHATDARAAFANAYEVCFVVAYDLGSTSENFQDI
jgi:tetratricopeptide (TPR) repeat protein